MKTKHLLSLIQTGYHTVEVTFDKAGNGQRYTYKSNIHVHPGDVVVVDTPRSGLTVAWVADVHVTPKIDSSAAFEYKWIVDRVDVEGYDAIMRREKQINTVIHDMERKAQRANVIDKIMSNYAEHPEVDKIREELDQLLDMGGKRGCDHPHTTKVMAISAGDIGDVLREIFSKVPGEDAPEKDEDDDTSDLH